MLPADKRNLGAHLREAFPHAQPRAPLRVPDNFSPANTLLSIRLISERPGFHIAVPSRTAPARRAERHGEHDASGLHFRQPPALPWHSPPLPAPPRSAEGPCPAAFPSFPRRHLLEAQAVEVLPDQPDHVLVGLREPLLLLQGAAAAAPQIRGGRAGPPGGGHPVVDTEAAGAAAAAVGRGQQPVGVGQLLAGGRARRGLAVLGSQTAQLRALRRLLLLLLLAPSCPVGLHGAAAAARAAAAASERGGGGGEPGGERGGLGRGEACSARGSPGLSCSLRRRRRGGPGFLPRGRGGSAGVRVGGGGSGGQSFLAESGRGGKPGGREGWGGRQGAAGVRGGGAGPCAPGGPGGSAATRSGLPLAMAAAAASSPRPAAPGARPAPLAARWVCLLSAQLQPNGVRAGTSQEIPILPPTHTSAARGWGWGTGPIGDGVLPGQTSPPRSGPLGQPLRGRGSGSLDSSVRAVGVRGHVGGCASAVWAVSAAVSPAVRVCS